MDVHIRNAFLWVKVDLKSDYQKHQRHELDEKGITLWVFRVIKPYFIQNASMLVDKVSLS